MKYRAEKQNRGAYCVYPIYDGDGRIAEAYSEAAAMFIVTALNLLTLPQQIAAHKAGAEKCVKKGKCRAA